MRYPVKSVVRAAAVVCAAMYARCPLMAQSQLPQTDVVRSQTQNQEQIRGETRKTAEDLSNIIAEFERNGLGDEADVQVLKAIRSVIGGLSDKEMAQVVSFLEAARGAADKGQALRNLADAIQTQKGIIIQMQQIVLEYQRQQELTDLSLRFARLANDQNRNMKAARELAKSTKGRAYSDEQTSILRVQKAEQAAIRDQVAGLLTKLETLSKTVDQNTAEKIARVVEDATNSRLLEALGQSVTDLDTGKLFSAVARERNVRDKCRDLSRMMAVAPDLATILREGINTLSAQIDTQKGIATDAGQLAGNEPARAEDLSDKQADLVDAADVLKKDISNVAPDAVEDINAAMNFMQEARAGFAGDPKGAARNGTDAMHKLEVARTRMTQQLALLDAQKANQDSLAEVKRLEEQIAALRQSQEKLKGETQGKTDAKALSELGTRQAELLKTAREIVLLAPGSVPAVGQALTSAASDMDLAQTALATNADADQAGKPQQSAIDNLAKAQKLLQVEAAELAKAEQELKNLEEAREKLAKTIQEQQKVQTAATDLAARKDQLPADKKAEAAADLTKKQDEVAKGLEEVKKNLEQAKKDAADPDAAAKADQKNPTDPQPPDAAKPEAKADAAKPDAMKDAAEPDAAAKADQKNPTDPQPPDAAKPAAKADAAKPDAMKEVAQAAEDMKDASKSLQKQDAQKAAQQANEALADLNKAKDALDKQIAEVQKKIGESPDNTAKLDDISKQLEQAQRELGDAQQQLDKMDQGQKPNDPAGAQKADEAAKKLGEIAAELTKAQAEDNGAMPEQADKAVDQAREALMKALAAAAGKDGKEAKDQAKQAQDALAQANAAMAMAKSGIRQNENSPQANSKKDDPSQKGEKGQKGKDGKKADEKKPGKPGEKAREDDTVSADGRSDGKGGPGSSAFMALPARERQVILQDRNEKYPEEYGTLIEKYTKNLADSSR